MIKTTSAAKAEEGGNYEFFDDRFDTGDRNPVHR